MSLTRDDNQAHTSTQELSVMGNWLQLSLEEGKMKSRQVWNCEWTLCIVAAEDGIIDVESRDELLIQKHNNLPNGKQETSSTLREKCNSAEYRYEEFFTF